MRSNKGGGCRTVKLPVDAKLETVLQSCTELFFPEGESVGNGKLKDMERGLHSFSGERIEEDTFTVGAYITATGLKNVRLYLYTKPKKW